jgi:hypothetical protein
MSLTELHDSPAWSAAQHLLTRLAAAPPLSLTAERA